VNLKTGGEVQQRARRVARVAWAAVAAFSLIVTIASFAIQPHLAASFAAMPLGFVFPVLALAGLAGSITFLLRQKDGSAFLASCLYIVGMLTSVVFGVFPNVLPSNADPSLSLTVANASAPDYGLSVGLAWFIPGILLVAAYFTFLYRKFYGKVSVEGGGH
jgi:cytochrome d ubiquinol oxidase subunit II